MDEETRRPGNKEGTVDPTMSGTAPEPTNPGGRIDQDRVLTSSGVAPTGGVPVGGEADRVQPDRWARRHGSASGAVDPGENYEGENSDVLVQPAAQAGRNE